MAWTTSERLVPGTVRADRSEVGGREVRRIRQIATSRVAQKTVKRRMTDSTLKDCMVRP